MKSYQRIIRDGTVVSNGSIDTAAKFDQLTEGVSLVDATVLDVGCNHGEMCRLAKIAGAMAVRGIDKDPTYIHEARELHPDVPFDVQTAERCSRRYDYLLCSAMLHYVADLDAVLAQFARCTRVALLCDVVIEEAGTDQAVFTMSDRGLLVPNWRMWELIAFRHFKQVRYVRPALSPDASKRFVFHCAKPKPIPPKAVLIHGPGGSGKTTRARELRYGFGYEHLETDFIFLDWRINVEPGTLSNMDFLKSVWTGPSSRRQQYLAHHAQFLNRWLDSRECRDVVIEGYDLVDELYRAQVLEILGTNGWSDIECQNTRSSSI